LFKRTVFDIETDNLLPDLTKLHCLVLRCLDTGELLSCANDPRYRPFSEGLEVLKKAELVVGHNILKFDIPALQKLYPGFELAGTVRDTLTISRLVWTDLMDRDFNARKKFKIDMPPRLTGSQSLEAWGYRLKVLKGDFRHANTDWSKWTQEMQTYCEGDTASNAALWFLIERRKYSEQAIQLEHDFQRVILKQEKRGFSFDEAGAGLLYAKIAARRNTLKEELQTIFPPTVTELKSRSHWLVGAAEFPTKGEASKFCKQRKAPLSLVHPGPFKTRSEPFNPDSRMQVAARLKEKYDWVSTEKTEKGGPKIDDAILSGLPFPEAKPLAEYFLLTKRIGQLSEGKEAWLRHVKNGRIHGELNTNGCVTGRCSHHRPNLAQVPKHPAPFGRECRSLFRATPGMVLVGCDAKGLELRCLAHFMAQFDKGAYAKIVCEGDVHTENQNAAGLSKRDQAKTFIYAFLYGAGDERLGMIVNPAATKQQKIAAGKSLRAKFLKSLPALGKLIAAVKAQAAERKFLTGLDGRHIHVRSQHAALNSLLQCAGALIMKQAAVFLEEALQKMGLIEGVDYAYVANVHDEMQLETKEHLADEIGRAAIAAIRRAGEHFNFRCPLDGDAKVGQTWHDTH